MKIRTKIMALALAACMTSCAAPVVSHQEVAAARFAALPSNYQGKIKASLGEQLKDPYSAVYRFDPPRKGFFQDGYLVGGQKHFGWITRVGINAKNSFGAYVGEHHYYFFMFEGRTIDCTDNMGINAAFID